MRFAAVTSLVWCLSSLALLAACGDDDSTGSGTKSSEKEVVYASVEDLPECNDKSSETLANVAGKYYTCVSSKWEKIEEFVNGSCNVRPCDKDLEGEWAYVLSDGIAYQCKSGSWVDQDGKGFAEKEFVACFVDAIVRDSVSKSDELGNCTEKLEGTLSAVGKNLVACVEKKWTELSGYVVSKADLPECTKNGSLEYVLSKMTAYQCKDGKWYKGGESPSATEASADDGTKVRGMCIVSEKEAVKGAEVKYSFYNLGGTVVSYSWNFDESASESTSSAAVPKISYKKGGVHKAKLVINKGRKSQSDEIECMGVSVNSAPVTGCVCNTDATNLKMQGKDHVEAAWTVSGCEGNAPFVYEWGNGASGSGTSATGKTTEAGLYAPVVTVTNSDGGTMEPVCKAVMVVGNVRADCEVNWNDFRISNITGVPEGISSIDVTIASKVDEVSVDLTIEAYTSSHYECDRNGENCERIKSVDWSMANAYVPIARPNSSYARYAAIYEGDTICTASEVKCAPDGPVYKGQPFSWGIQSMSYPPPEPKKYLWNFELETKTGKETSTSTLGTPQFTATNYGIVKATLTLDKGLPTENVLTCSDAEVNPPPITGCTCGEPELLSTSGDVAEVDTVSYRWTVLGCESEGSESLTYQWSDSYTVDKKDPTKVIGNFVEAGTYSPAVLVTSSEGQVEKVSCSNVDVTLNGGGPYTEVEYGFMQILGSGRYSILHCNENSEENENGALYVNADAGDVIGWFESDVTVEDEPLEHFEVAYPVLLNIPDGESLYITGCN